MLPNMLQLLSTEQRSLSQLSPQDPERAHVNQQSLQSHRLTLASIYRLQPPLRSTVG